MAIRCIRIKRARNTISEISRKTILLAEKLGISVVVDFSGCPGDSPQCDGAELGNVSMASGLFEGS